MVLYFLKLKKSHQYFIQLQKKNLQIGRLFAYSRKTEYSLFPCYYNFVVKGFSVLNFIILEHSILVHLVS